MTDLMIVESPKKAKTIQAYLKGQDIIVKASVGHVRDLPEKEMGVAAPDYKPNYVFTERGKKVIKELKELAKNAENVYLASDPDREGEAIAWHLQDTLKLKNYQRVEYNEITKSAIQFALQNPRQLNLKLIASQEARRILDRLVGFKVSTFIRQGTGLNLPAGRVQSPACKLVVIRENEIREFKPISHFGIKAQFEKWAATLDLKKCVLKKDENYLVDKAIVNKILDDVTQLKITDIDEVEKNISPAAPFKTSEMQQAAFNKFSFSSDRTMKAAQSLYEKGMITYHRTDSINISDEGFDLIKEYAASKNYPVLTEKNTWKEKQDAQMAHEAIRPSDFNADTSELEADELKLYELILNRVVASQLKDAINKVKTITLHSDDYIFTATGSVNIFQGWKAVYESDEDENEESEDQKLPSDLAVGNLYKKDSDFKLIAESKKTKAPVRYNQATLTKALEKLGIGRPSTYASIMQRIITHGYLEEKSEGKSKKKYLYATDKAFKLFECLENNFDFFDLHYTKELEDKLDKIAMGKAKYREVLTELDNDLDNSMSNTKLVNQYDFDCSCGAKLKRLHNKAKKTYWWGCSNYPECKITYFDKDERPDYDSAKNVTV